MHIYLDHSETIMRQIKIDKEDSINEVLGITKVDQDEIMQAKVLVGFWLAIVTESYKCTVVLYNEYPFI